MKTKDRILQASLHLFNLEGATEITTNDISKNLNMSPGNLYFHYKNKEQIIREVFKKLIKETESVWKPQTKLAKKSQPVPLIEFIENNMQLYWKFRFFHREHYTLRKNDPELNKLWKTHVKKLRLLMIILYKHWVKSGFMVPIKSKSEMDYVGDLLFISANSFMQFFDSTQTALNSDMAPPDKMTEKAKRHILRMLFPYLDDKVKVDIEKII